MLKHLVTRLPPFPQNSRDEAIGTNPDVTGPDDQIMGVGLIQRCGLVGGDALVLIVPLGHELPDGTAYQLRQIPHDEAGVFPGKLDLAAEGKVVTNKDAGPGDDAGGEGLVVAVAQSEHPAVVRADRSGLDFHQSEVTLSFVGEAVSPGADLELMGRQGLFNGGDKLAVRDGSPGVGRRRCAD